MRTSLLFILIFSITSHSHSQNTKHAKPAQDLKPVAADCRNAIKIPLVKKGIYGPTVAPKGFGAVQEIKCTDPKSVHFFAKEHNTAWYYFDVQVEGELLIEIIPEKRTDDYDFLLFKWPDTTCCDDKDEIPIRTNISRSGKTGDGRTGLSRASASECVKSGAGETFSKPIYVKKRERYFLVLDNVYPNGKGHTIKFYYQKQVELSGTVTDEKKNPLKAEVIIEDLKGNSIYKGESDAATGEFRFSTPLLDETSYTVTFYNDSSFFSCRTLHMDSLEKVNYKISGLKIVLPKLEAGKKYLMEELIFQKHTTDILPQSDNPVNSLSILMKRNSKMIIRIEGHANDPFGNIGEDNCLKLSEMRAKKINELLLAKGINKLRVSIAWHGREEMAFPNAINQREYEANRRVEVTVISLR